MKNPRNRIASASQYTEAIEGYVFDGADGSQVAFWRCAEDRVSREHVHDFDEYVLVIEGRATVILHEGAHAPPLDGGLAERRIELNKGDELVIPKGTRQSMAVVAGTRTMHVFGGRRAERERT
jgi:mannose-6-phosphate isomerase-like protein (cupin superfamily)